MAHPWAAPEWGTRRAGLHAAFESSGPRRPTVTKRCSVTEDTITLFVLAANLARTCILILAVVSEQPSPARATSVQKVSERSAIHTERRFSCRAGVHFQPASAKGRDLTRWQAERRCAIFGSSNRPRGSRTESVSGSTAGPPPAWDQLNRAAASGAGLPFSASERRLKMVGGSMLGWRTTAHQPYVRQTHRERRRSRGPDGSIRYQDGKENDDDAQPIRKPGDMFFNGRSAVSSNPTDQRRHRDRDDEDAQLRLGRSKCRPKWSGREARRWRGHAKQNDGRSARRLLRGQARRRSASATCANTDQNIGAPDRVTRYQNEATLAVCAAVP